MGSCESALGSRRSPGLHARQVQDRLPRDAEPHVAGLLLGERRGPVVERLDAPADLVEAALGITELDDQRYRALSSHVGAVLHHHPLDVADLAEIDLDPGVLLLRGME